MTDVINAGSEASPAAAKILSAGSDLLDDPGAVMVSVVMPCLNEEESVGRCVAAALNGIRKTGLTGEVIVCDNGSSDRSVEVARESGAVVVTEPRRGYGNAYRRGFAAARGRYLVMGDSDCSYDFSRLDELVAPLLDGYEYVLGSRFGGAILPGAMPWTHRYIGNPVLTGALNRLFGLKTSDAHSGMRAFTREAYRRMGLRSEGMEFASEVVVSAAQAGLRMTEVPIVYHPRLGESKLRGLRDALRHLRYMLLQCPRQLFVFPGSVLLALGLVAQLVVMASPLERTRFSLGVLLASCFALLAVLGYQSVLLGLFAQLGTARTGPGSAAVRWIDRQATLGRGMIFGLMLVVLGAALDVVLLITGAGREIGLAGEVHAGILSLTLMAIGVQTTFAGLFVGVLRHPSRGAAEPPPAFADEQIVLPPVRGAVR
jgi:glycosyltransferase involved in cell wall biosynthesis